MKQNETRYEVPVGWPLRAAAGLGGLFSALAVFAGSRVLLGLDVPDYVVLPWLVWYNVGAGLFGVGVAVGLWRGGAWAITTAGALAAAHGAILTVLIVMRLGGGAVANDSLAAMTLRTLVWSAIALVARRTLRVRP